MSFRCLINNEINNRSGLSLLWVGILLLIVPVAFYFRTDLFYLWDDWTELDLLAHKSFIKYLVTPNGEIYFPFFHLIYYGLINIAGERYWILVIVNCIGTSLTAFLLYLFLSRHFKSYLPLLFSFLYAGSVLQQAIVWNAFYLCYILSLSFFLLALLYTDSYSHNSSYYFLFPIALFALLSIHSHNYTLLALLTLPLYVILMGEGDTIKKSLALAGVIGFVLMLFSFEYLSFAGLRATTLYNHNVFLAMPGFAFLRYWFYGAFLSPVYFFYWGHSLHPSWAMIFSLTMMTVMISVISLWGKPSERKFALWALLLNAVPFFLVSLGRHLFPIHLSFSPRYVFFTAIGAILIAGVAWSIIYRKIPLWQRPLSYVLLAAMILGQILSQPFWQSGYLKLSQNARDCYHDPSLIDKVGRMWQTPHHPLEKRQIIAIRQFLRGEDKCLEK